MPRRNRRVRRKSQSSTRAPRETYVPARTSDQMAFQLVSRGLASPTILESSRNPLPGSEAGR